MIYADFVIEHIDDPIVFIGEIKRVLRKGGYFIFRTPNLYHYFPLVAMIVPARFKSVIANFVRNIDIGQKTFPVVYKLNTISRLKTVSRQNGLVIEELMLIEKEPSYFMFNTFAFLLGVFYERVVNSAEMLRTLRSNVIGVFRKN